MLDQRYRSSEAIQIEYQRCVCKRAGIEMRMGRFSEQSDRCCTAARLIVGALGDFRNKDFPNSRFRSLAHG